MNKIIFGLLLLTAIGSLSSCEDSSKIPAPEVTSVPLVVAKPSTDPKKDHFNTTRAAFSITRLASDPNPTRPVFEFTFDIPNQRDVKIKTVEVYKSFKQLTSIGPRVLVGEYSSFPATVTLNSQEALTGLQRLLYVSGVSTPTLDNLLGDTPSSRNEIVSGDVILFTFEYVLEDGSRVILTPLTDVRLASGPPAKVISGNQVNPPYALQALFIVR
ncbi:MAG TPA: hypothetical protein VF629_21750 [Hymenobacter sp.]|jgi:hypothetical protein|uniref:hypothetical protein n=1 Tax=Hymenobacter sp. TaxID=1898978 RepID=UPI002ED9502C